MSAKPATTTAIILIIAALLAGFLTGRITAEPVERTVFKTQTETLAQTVTRTVSVVETRTALERVEVREPEVKYAKLFSLQRGDGYVLVRDAVNRTILVVPRGSPVPSIKADLVVLTPVERVVLMSATHVALLERLREFDPSLLDRVAALMWGRSYEWYFPEVGRLLAAGRITDVGAAWAPDYEKLASVKPDLVMVYTFPADPVVSKLEELKLPYVVNNEFMETDLLGRFEWIKFVAVFFGLDQAGAKVFEHVETSYAMVSMRARMLVDRGFTPSPKVAWFSVFRGTVYVAGGESYVAKALQDLGAEYVFSDLKTTASATVSAEELVARALDADVIVVSTDLTTSAEDLLKEVPQLAQSKALRENRVYRYNSNIFQLGYYATEEWARELAALLHPGVFTAEEPYDFFVRLS
ncbi:MAG: ABC transporter substrate-binding protein [Candidatus Caldarchaeum sp.]|uniref:Fe/B12 periplasmic-binding domain-containing protein n=1 Tax=Caldiarchaeum subterraneum TaxID=311458 RepID=A0A7J3VT50_CALS0